MVPARLIDFREAIHMAANLGGDADTVAAITWQLTGSLYGDCGIPQRISPVQWANSHSGACFHDCRLTLQHDYASR